MAEGKSFLYEVKCRRCTHLEVMSSGIGISIQHKLNIGQFIDRLLRTPLVLSCSACKADAAVFDTVSFPNYNDWREIPEPLNAEAEYLKSNEYLNELRSKLLKE